MLSNPAVGNGSQKFKRKLTNKHVKGHTNTGAGQGTHCPGLKTPKPGDQKHQHRSWARKTPIQELKTHRPGGENSGKGKHQEWEPKNPIPKAGRKHTNPGTGNTKTWEPETPREPKKTNLGKGNTTGRENTNLGIENTQPKRRTVHCQLPWFSSSQFWPFAFRLRFPHLLHWLRHPLSALHRMLWLREEMSGSMS